MKKFAYLTSVSTFIFSCAPALVSPVASARSQELHFKKTYFLTLSPLPGVFGHIRSVCWCQLRQCVDRWESFHCYLTLQHPPLSLGHAAYAHCCHCASKDTTSHVDTKTLHHISHLTMYFAPLDNSVHKTPGKVFGRGRPWKWHCAPRPQFQYVHHRHFHLIFSW